MKLTVIPIVIGALGTIPKGLVKGLEDRNQRKSRDHLDYSIIKIGQNMKKSPGDLRRLCCHSYFSEGPSPKVGVKNSLGVNNNDNYIYLLLNKIVVESRC